MVSSRNEVGFNFVSKFLGFELWGEEFSMATAYAFESVLKAVGEVGSISPFSAVVDLPRVCAVAGVLICRDSLGRFGGEGDRDEVSNDIVTDGYV